MSEEWKIKGELILNCNCTVFCPCVVSLGAHPPTEGYCQAWAGVKIDSGNYGDHNLTGVNVALLLDIPGLMSRGNWKVAMWVDEKASDPAFDGLVNIFSGKAGGTTGLFKMLVSEFLGAERAPVSYTTEGNVRRLEVPKKILGEVQPIVGQREGEEVVVSNTEYWMGSDITIAKALKGKVRAFGRVWNFDNRSAEICQISWSGSNL